MKRIIFIGILVSVFAFSGLAFAVLPPPIHVYVDIKPESCPNPFNFGSKGVLPVAILGTDALDVNDIDVASIQLEGVAPLPSRTKTEDVAAPYGGNECGCTTEGPDGWMDLTLKFDAQEVAAAIGGVGVHGEIKKLYLTLSLLDGTAIQGSDCVVVVGSQRDGIPGIDLTIDAVTICHIAPGNPAAARTLSIGARGVSAHLAHGDFLGPCPPD